MKELIKINYDKTNKPTVLGRDLHKFLKLKTPYIKWFERMLEYGFEQDKDFVEIVQKSPRQYEQDTSTRTIINHQMTLHMAKEIGMIQRNDIGKKIRNYFIKCEDMLKDIIHIKNINTNSEEWKKLREESKKTRFQETDEIKRLTEYARESGSENAETYYTHFSNLIWKHLFDVEIECKNKRNILNANQLQVVIQAENIIKKCITDGIKEKIDYHDIYAKAKKNIEIFATLIEITKIPYYTQISMI